MSFERNDYFSRDSACIFALSNKGVWRPVEIRAYEDEEVLIHYTGYDNKHDESIPMHSERFFVNSDLENWGSWEKHLCELVTMEKRNKKVLEENGNLRNQLEVQDTLLRSLKNDSAQLAQQLETEKKKSANQKEESSTQIFALKEQIRILMDQHVEMKNASTPAPQSKEEDNEVLDRVMQTLATAQEQLMKKEEELNAIKQNLNMINSENKDYRKAHDSMSKDKDKLIKDNKKLQDQLEKLKSKVAESSKVDESKQIVETLSKRASELEEMLSIARMEAENAKDALREKSTHADELAGKIEGLEFQAKEKDARLQHESEKFERVNSELDEVQKTFKESKEEYESQLDSVHAAREKLTIEVDDLRTKLDKLTEEHGDASVELNRTTTLITELEAELSALKEASAQKEIENDTERKIAHKRLSDLVKQLRSQLKKETIKNQALQAELAEARDSLNDAGPSSAVSKPSTSPNLSDADTASSISVGDAIDPSVTSEFADAMTAKLTQQTEENFKLKTKIKFLEGSIQEMTEELYQRKVTLRNIMLRIDTGALTTEQEQQGRKAKKLGKNRKVWEELVNRMEIVVTETSLQNDHLRKEKKQMGADIVRMCNENKQLKDLIRVQKEPQQSKGAEEEVEDAEP